MGHSDAATRGINCDERGAFVKSFVSNLGSRSITRTEMTGIVAGLEMAWSLGSRRIRVQADSNAAISILSKASSLNHQHAILVLWFQELCRRSWVVDISHVYRETNYAADYLANLDHSFFLGLTFLIHRIGSAFWLNYNIIIVSLMGLVPLTSNNN
ncbi:Putative ribonuclease H protein At1g65750 [Linum grandiflorum]